MRGKLLGITACAVLVVCAALLSWFSVDIGFWHQHLGEGPFNERVPAQYYDSAGTKTYLDKSDYRLNEYLFSNLAGELLPRAPVIFYAQEEDRLVQYQQRQENCILPECEYAILINHDEAGSLSGHPTNPRRLITFADYNYLDASNRRNFIVIDGFRTSKSIRLDISRIEKSLYSYDYDSKLYGYRGQINVQCFTDFFLLYELAYSGNRIENPTLLYLDSDGKYCVCTGAFPGSASCNKQDDYHNLINSTWFTMLLKSPDFTDNVIREYRYQREHFFSEAYLFDYIEGISGFLAQSELVDPVELERQKEALYSYLLHRLEWLDSNIDSLREFSALSSVKEYRNTPY